MKILIIAHYFPPENNMAMMATLRPYSWAKYWSKAGHEICVLTTYKTENQVVNLPKDLRVEGIKYLLSRPESNDLDKAQNTKKRANTLYPFLRQILINTRQLIGVGHLFYGSDLWIFPAIKKGLSIYKEWQFDIVVSTFGPPASHIVASFLNKITKAFWVADYRDLWYDYHFTKARFPFSLIERKLEDSIVKDANMITTVSSPLADRLRQRFNKSVVVISNGFEAPEIVQKRSQIVPEKIRLAYTGNIYFKKQDLSPLFQAVELLIKQGIFVEDRLEILFYGWDMANLSELIEQYHLNSIVTIHGFIDREAVIFVQRDVDALIFLDWNDLNVDGVITGKIFEYMFSGTPILGIGASLATSAGRLIQESGTGVLLGNSVEGIANTIKKLLNGESLEYSPRQEILQQYTREFLADKMLQEIIINYNKYSNVNL